MRRLLWWFMAVLACVAAGCIAASAYLTFATLRSAQQEAFDARFALAAQRAATAAERALALGVALTDQPPLQALLEREGKADELAQRLDMRYIIIALLSLANEAHKSNHQPMGAKIKNITAILKDPVLKAILTRLDLSEAESRKKLELTLMKKEASVALYLYYSLFNRIKAAMGKG